MRPLRYSINVTLDGCCHHEAGLPPDEESMRYWTAQLERADALLFGRVTYEMNVPPIAAIQSGTLPNSIIGGTYSFGQRTVRGSGGMSMCSRNTSIGGGAGVNPRWPHGGSTASNEKRKRRGASERVLTCHRPT
jgi:hypothetical protein